jgi:hypothetical protein
MSQVSAAEASEALKRVSAARRALAERVRLPLWYSLLYAASAFALFLLPALVVRPHHHLPWGVVPIVILAASIVLAMHGPVLRASSGVRVSAEDARSFSAVKPAVILVVGIVALGSALTWLAATTASWGVALACGAISALALCGARAWTLVALRHDIRVGCSEAR